MLTDQQFAELLTVLKPLADYANVMLAKERKGNAPNLFRPLADYDGFDWETNIPGCTIVARDRDGVTEVEYDGHVFRRYRSSEDDAKGRDIRYKRVVSGTVADKNMVWATLIKFGEPKAVRPLNNSVKSAVAEAHAAKAHAPAAPAQKPTPPPTQPTQPAQPAPDPNDVRVLWGVAMRAARAAGANPPPALDLEASNTDGQIRHKTMSLICVALCAQAQHDMAGTDAEHFVAQCQAARIAYDDALAAGAAVPPTMALTLEDTLTVIEAKLSTLSNLRDAARRTAGQRVAETTKAPDPTPADVVIERLNAAARRNLNRSMSRAQDGLTVRALEALCGNEALRHVFTLAVFQKSSYADLQVAQRLALFDWLKPAEQNGAAGATNPNASASAAAVLAAAKQPVAV